MLRRSFLRAVAGLLAGLPFGLKVVGGSTKAVPRWYFYPGPWRWGPWCVALPNGLFEQITPVDTRTDKYTIVVNPGSAVLSFDDRVVCTMPIDMPTTLPVQSVLALWLNLGRQPYDRVSAEWYLLTNGTLRYFVEQVAYAAAADRNSGVANAAPEFWRRLSDDPVGRAFTRRYWYAKVTQMIRRVHTRPDVLCLPSR